MKQWLIRVLVGADQFWNAIFAGDPDETISSRVGRAAQSGSRVAIILEALINVPFAFAGQRNHCERHIEGAAE